MQSPRFIFIVGNSRSGTTLLAEILGLHSMIFSFRELHFFEELYDPTNSRRLENREAINLVSRLICHQEDGYYARSAAGQYEPHARTLLNQWTSRDPLALYLNYVSDTTAHHGKSIACDHTPRYSFYVRYILDRIPDSIVIHMVRDPRAVLHSQKNRWRRIYLSGTSMRWNDAAKNFLVYHPVTTSIVWKNTVRRVKSHLSSRLIHLRYEDLVGDPETVVRYLLQRLDIDYQPEMLCVTLDNSSFGRQAERKGIDISSRDSWRFGSLRSAEILLTQLIARREMLFFGFTPIKIPFYHWLGAFFYLLTWPLHMLGLALVYSGRAKNIFKAARARFT
jgi:hypothetical protein